MGTPTPQRRPVRRPGSLLGTPPRHDPGERDKTFFGYYLQAATITKEEHGPEVPELVHRIHLASCDHDPPPAFVPVLQRMHNNGIPISDVLADCGYSYRQP